MNSSRKGLSLPERLGKRQRFARKWSELATLVAHLHTGVAHTHAALIIRWIAADVFGREYVWLSRRTPAHQLPTLASAVGIFELPRLLPSCLNKVDANGKFYSHRNSRLVLQRLGGHLLSSRHVAAQTASAGARGSLLRCRRNQHIVLRTHQARNSEALGAYCVRCKPQLSLHRKIAPLVHALASGCNRANVGGFHSP